MENTIYESEPNLDLKSLVEKSLFPKKVSHQSFNVPQNRKTKNLPEGQIEKDIILEFFYEFLKNQFDGYTSTSLEDIAQTLLQLFESLKTEPIQKKYFSEDSYEFQLVRNCQYGYTSKLTMIKENLEGTSTIIAVHISISDIIIRLKNIIEPPSPLSRDSEGAQRFTRSDGGYVES